MAAVLGLAVAAYTGVIHAGFVWDDVPLVVQNKLLSRPDGWAHAFGADLWATSSTGEHTGYYRPLFLLSVAFDRVLWGLSPAGYHLQNLAWHLLAVVATWRLLRLLAPPGAALVGALIFALHPAQSEAVAWVAARNDPMAAALGTGALALVVPWNARTGRLVIGALLTLMAGLSKESVALLPLYLALIDLGRGGAFSSLRLRAPAGRWAVGRCGLGPWRRYLALVGGLAMVAALRVAALVQASGWPEPLGWMLLGRRWPQVVVTLAATVVSPWPLSGARALEWLAPSPARVALGLGALVVAFAGIFAVHGVRRRRAVLGLGWVLLALAPTVIPVAARGLVGDRYLYLAMVGIALWGVAVFGRSARWLAAVLVVPYLLILWVRLPDWSSDLTLWRAAVRDTPGPFAFGGYAHALNRDGHPELALPWFRRALAAEPPDKGLCPYVVGSALKSRGALAAVAMGRWAEQRGCRVDRDGRFAGQLAVAEAYAGDWAAARATVAPGAHDPDGRLDVVRAALDRLDGDDAAWHAELEAWSGEVSLVDQVRDLLVKGGHPEVAPPENPGDRASP